MFETFGRLLVPKHLNPKAQPSCPINLLATLVERSSTWRATRFPSAFDIAWSWPRTFTSNHVLSSTAEVLAACHSPARRLYGFFKISVSVTKNKRLSGTIPEDTSPRQDSYWPKYD
ncbi:hypothetical protein WG66_006520 [Moniliophthora roreri]|nr:hypothetical protein WG66_006520 [Moniliophthora roreri]